MGIVLLLGAKRVILMLLFPSWKKTPELIKWYSKDTGQFDGISHLIGSTRYLLTI